MGNACCYKKSKHSLRSQRKDERTEAKHLESGLGSAKGLQEKSKPDRELLLSKKQSEADEELRVSTVRRAAFIRPRQPTDLMSGSRFRKQTIKEDSPKNVREPKFVAGHLEKFSYGKVIHRCCECGRDRYKYTVEECLGQDSGTLFSLKTIVVTARLISSTKMSAAPKSTWTGASAS